MPGGRVVLDGVTMICAPGTVTAVVARNGTGKSTLARVLAGVDRPDAGAVVRPSRGVYFLPERVPVLMGCSARTVTAALAPALGRLAGRADYLTRLEDGLAWLGSTHSGDAPLGRLSKGNAQKAYLAVAYALRPAVAVLDEPATGLDPASVAASGEVIRSLADAGGVVVLTAHGAVGYADLRLRLEDGLLQTGLTVRHEADVAVELELGRAGAADWRAGRLGCRDDGTTGYDVVDTSRPDGERLRLRVKAESVPRVLRIALDRGDAVIRVTPEDV